MNSLVCHLFFCMKSDSMNSFTVIRFMKQKYHLKTGVGNLETSLENKKGAIQSIGPCGSWTISCTSVLAIIDAALLLSWYFIMNSRSYFVYIKLGVFFCKLVPNIKTGVLCSMMHYLAIHSFLKLSAIYFKFSIVCITMNSTPL